MISVWPDGEHTESSPRKCDCLGRICTARCDCTECHKEAPHTSQWEEEYWDKYVLSTPDGPCLNGSPYDLKHFIRHLLSSARTEESEKSHDKCHLLGQENIARGARDEAARIIAIAESLKKEVRYKGTGTPSQRAKTHNAALTDLIKKIQSNAEENDLK